MIFSVNLFHALSTYNNIFMANFWTSQFFNSIIFTEDYWTWHWLGNLIQSDQSGERVSLMPGSQTWLILRSWGVMQCVCGGSLTHTPSAGGHLWSQQWEDQRCWPQHSRTDVCTAHYTCSSSLLHPSSLHTHTHNNQCSSHACRLFGISNYSVEKCRLLPILMMCTTIYTSFLRSPLPRSWIKHQWQSISTDYSAWLLLHRFHLNTHHKKCALSFSLLRKLGQTVFIEFNKEPFTAKQTENKRNAFSLYEFILLFKKHSYLQQLHF